MASVVRSRQPGRGRGRPSPQRDRDDQGFEDVLVKLFRCATVVKGGRRFSFGAVVVVGDRRGKVSYGYGKANEVPPAVEKAIKQAKRHLIDVPLRGTTIPHRVIGRYGASRIVLIPASEGTGVIAGAAARSVLELAGIKDVLTKSYGSTAAKNLVKATIDGLQQLRTRAQIEGLRGVTLDLPPEPKPEPKPEPEPVAAHVDQRPDPEPPASEKPLAKDNPPAITDSAQPTPEGKSDDAQ